MIIGPKYKIARRLGAPIFEKTQTQKYNLRTDRKIKNKSFSKAKSEYGYQKNEKQKARMYYGVSEKQFSKYVKESIEKKASKAVSMLFETLEKRLDNVVSRVGLSTTHRGARQMVSHGHILVNDKKVRIPSRQVKIGDIISIREGSKESPLFLTFDERFKNTTLPSWIEFDAKSKTFVVKNIPNVDQVDTMFNLPAVIEFYSR